MADTPIKDENLRLVLSKGHEAYLLARIKERNFGNRIIVGIWVIIPALAFLTETSSKWPWIINYLLVLTSPLAAIVIGRNMWMANKHWKEYCDHSDFLKKYKRDPNPAVSHVKRIRDYSMNGGSLGAVTVVVLSIVYLVMLPNFTPEPETVDSADADCTVFLSDPKKKQAEAFRRAESNPNCNNVVIQNRR